MHTLQRLRDELGVDRPLVLLVGADAFAGLPTWHRWRDLFGLAHIAVAQRPGFPVAAGRLPPELAALPAEELNELVAGASYGWPYCVSDARGRSVATRGYEKRVRCANHRAPFAAWPAHAAFAYDNESPVHRVLVPAHALANRPVSNAEYWQFIAAGGYAEVGLCCSGGD